MTDFIADPDAHDLPDEIAMLPTRRVTGGSTGLHPEAAVPRQRGPDPAPCAVLCAFCGTRILHG